MLGKNLARFQLHQRAMADLFGYNPKSEDLEASMLFIYTTDLYNKNRFPHIRKAVSFNSVNF